MRVGLLTYHWVPNFGAQLQTLSTYKYLEKAGFNPIVINWVPKETKQYYSIINEQQRKQHLRFISSLCELTEEFSDPLEISNVISNNGITGVVIGSDSLFNIQVPKRNLRTMKISTITPDHLFPNPFWGTGFETLPHVGLSISSQNADYMLFSQQMGEIAHELKMFKHITVRDEWTQSLVSFFTGGEIIPEVTPDPVFAFNSNVNNDTTKHDIRSQFNLPEKYVLFSFSVGRMEASEAWLKKIKKMFNEEGYACIQLPKISGGQKFELDASIKLPLDPFEWYNLIRFSSGYVGVLMHPIIVCLHNSIPFFSFDHYGAGTVMFAKKSSSKIFDILNQAELLNCHYFLKHHLSFPSPKRVFNSIVNFPIEKCGMFAEKQQAKCLENMQNITSYL